MFEIFNHLGGMLFEEVRETEGVTFGDGDGDCDCEDE
jgi:hypothetical protein